MNDLELRLKLILGALDFLILLLFILCFFINKKLNNTIDKVNEIIDKLNKNDQF